MGFIGNLDREVPEETLRALFLSCGEIVEIRLATNNAGERRPFAHIEFATAEAAVAAIRMNGTEISGETIKVEAPRQDEYSTKTVYVCNLPDNVSKLMLRPVFETCGTVKEVRLDENKSYAHVEYEEEDACTKALGLNGTEVDGTIITVEKAVRGRKRKRFARRFGVRGRGRRGRGRRPATKEETTTEFPGNMNDITKYISKVAL